MADATLTGELRPVTPASDLTVPEQIEGVRVLALTVQGRMRRVMEMMRVLQDASDDMDTDDGERVRICADIAREAASTAEDDGEAIEIACNGIRRALTGGN